MGEFPRQLLQNLWRGIQDSRLEMWMPMTRMTHDVVVMRHGMRTRSGKMTLMVVTVMRERRMLFLTAPWGRMSRLDQDFHLSGWFLPYGNVTSLRRMFLLPASLMTRWNSLFLHTLTHGQGWVGGVGMMTFLSLAHMWHATHLTFLALAHMWHATHVMGRVGWVGWDHDVFFTCTHMTCYALDVSCTCTHVTCYGLGNQSLNVALWNLPVLPTTKCSLQSGTLKLDWQGLKR